MNNPSDVEQARDEERQVVEQLQAIPEGCGYGYGAPPRPGPPSRRPADGRRHRPGAADHPGQAA
ncbi:hypothetical protein ACIQKE_16280 [Streptomyces griseoviridis]